MLPGLDSEENIQVLRNETAAGVNKGMNKYWIWITLGNNQNLNTFTGPLISDIIHRHRNIT